MKANLKCAAAALAVLMLAIVAGVAAGQILMMLLEITSRLIGRGMTTAVAIGGVFAWIWCGLYTACKRGNAEPGRGESEESAP